MARIESADRVGQARRRRLRDRLGNAVETVEDGRADLRRPRQAGRAKRLSPGESRGGDIRSSVRVRWSPRAERDGGEPRRIID